MYNRFPALLICCFFWTPTIVGQHSIAREWNEELLEAIRNDFARPTVHARNLFHSSAMMYDIWSYVMDEGETYFLGDTLGEFIFEIEPFTRSFDEESEQKEYIEDAISYAMFDLLNNRFLTAPDFFGTIRLSLIDKMTNLGLDPNVSTDRYPEDSSAVALGRYVARQVLEYGWQDGSNETNGYRNTFYLPVNEPTLVSEPGNDELIDPNRWQPLAFNVFIDQSGNEIIGNIPSFLGAEWGRVTPFALSEEDLEIFNDSTGGEYWVYKDPGPPPYLSNTGTDMDSDLYRYGFSLVAVWSSMLDPTDGVMWDISPRTIGNIPDLPDSFSDYDDFYDYFEGGDISEGRSINPVTREPYAEQIVPRADYARVLAEFWADGPDSETPPGHWFTILHEVMDHPLFERKWQGEGEVLDTLEYDLRAFFTLGGTMHDAAVSTWGIKGWYDYIRPISVIRYMGGKGQSTDTTLMNYHPQGLPLIPGYIEVIENGDALAENDSSALGKIKMYAWKGPDVIDDPETDVAGVDWILAEAWWPYQRPTFVSPPFAGYTSGHSCFSRAAAEVLTLMTGDEYFPGGVGIFPIEQNEFLVFEDGPSVPMELQWATYRDASDQTSLSRIWGGIHPPQDDIPGRLIGVEIGIEAFNFANEYFPQLTTSTSEEIITEDVFAAYPSLASSDSRVQITSKYDGDILVSLFDMNARMVRSEKIRSGLTSLDLFGLKPGSYVLQMRQGQFKQVEQIVIVE